MENPASPRHSIPLWWRWFCGIALALGVAGMLADSVQGQMTLPLVLVKLSLLCLLPALLLRALCLGAPPIRRLVQALALFFVPPSFYFLTGFFRPLHLHAPVLIALFPAGLVLALFSLRGDIRTNLPLGARGALRSILVALALIGGTCFMTASYQALFHARNLEEERVALSSPPPPAHMNPERISLGPHNAKIVEENYRNIDLAAKITLNEGAILQVRVRAPRLEWPEGLSLFLSTDSRFETGFYLEFRDAFEPVGEGSGALPAGVPLALEVRTRGRSFEALVNADPVASAHDRAFASGSLVFLTARGTAVMEDLRIDVPDFDESEASSLPDRLEGAAAPLLFLLAYSLLAALFMRLPYLRILEATAFGLVPVGYCFHHLSPEGAMDVWLVAWSLLAASLLFLAFPMMHSRRLTGPRYFALVLLILMGNTWMFLYCNERSRPRDYVAISRLSIADWSGDRLEEDFLHFQHPLLRRWNPYLAQHALRERNYDMQKAPGVTRILSLGTSSTHGYWLKLPYTFRLELLLKNEGFDVETLVGAFPGGTGPRVYYYFKNALLDFSPDIVTLSLYYNDAYDLSQMDEVVYLKRITAPG